MAHAATFIKGIRSRDPGIAALCELLYYLSWIWNFREKCINLKKVWGIVYFFISFRLF